MNTRTGTIKAYLLKWILLFSALGFLVIFVIASHSYSSSTRDNANVVAERIARQTFSSMYMVMSQGWRRSQVVEFLDQLEQHNASGDLTVDLYRGPIVDTLYGSIKQGVIDAQIREVIATGKPFSEQNDSHSRYLYPLTANADCLYCHGNAEAGQTLGVIEVRQDLSGAIANARQDLIFNLLLIAPLPLLLGFFAVRVLTRRVDDSINELARGIDSVTTLSDLTSLKLRDDRLAFDELAKIYQQVGLLATRLRHVAVDKELLEFEIRLLEKFVITSDVVRDWREYVSDLLREINQVIDAHTMFSIFKVDDEVFDLEIFWLSPASDETRASMEKAVLKRLQDNDLHIYCGGVNIRHNVANKQGAVIELDQNSIELQCKSLLVDTPKIGGIVGIGVQAEIVRDQTKLLVLESILSTLLNVVGSVRAIYKYTNDLEYYATRDPLTNLYNQRMFWELLDYELDRCERHDYKVAVLMIDLDNFKSINDGYGHSCGDKLLESFAHCLETSFSSGDVIARYGGDEFVVMLPESSLERAQEAGQRLLDNIRCFSMAHGERINLQVTASVGVGVYPDHAQNKKDLFMFVDNMMYRAKQDGKDRLCVPQQQDLVSIFKDMSEKTLLVKHAIENRQLVPVFQPIQCTDDGSLAAVEVLSRIALPDDSLMQAAEFIEIAESMDKIHLLDYIVMDKAFETARQAGYNGLLFVNMSPRAVVVSDFIQRVKALTQQHDIAPDRVVFEITERDTVKSISVLEQFVINLKNEGFGLAIDDFGSGFSSFHYLKHLPIDYVKIEGEFIANMANDQRDMAFVNSIASLSRELNLKTIAEFVESDAVLQMVREAQINYAQGYHVGRPTPDLAGLIASSPEPEPETAE